MTKLRPPASSAQAMTRISGVVDINEIARMCRKSKRWAQACCDPDSGIYPTVEQAYQLDVAYSVRGGGGLPFLDALALRHEIEAPVAFEEQRALAADVAEAARECGEALAASVAATVPGAGINVHGHAIVEVEQGVTSLTRLMRRLKKGAARPGTIMHFGRASAVSEPPD